MRHIVNNITTTTMKDNITINDSLRNATTNHKLVFRLYHNIEGDEGFGAIALRALLNQRERYLKKQLRQQKKIIQRPPNSPPFNDLYSELHHFCKKKCQVCRDNQDFKQIKLQITRRKLAVLHNSFIAIVFWIRRLMKAIPMFMKARKSEKKENSANTFLSKWHDILLIVASIMFLLIGV